MDVGRDQLDTAVIEGVNQTNLKNARNEGDTLDYWQADDILLIGPGLPASYYEWCLAQDGGAQGTITVVSRGGPLSTGKIEVTNCPDEDTFKTRLREFSKKKIDFVGGGDDEVDEEAAPVPAIFDEAWASDQWYDTYVDWARTNAMDESVDFLDRRRPLPVGSDPRVGARTSGTSSSRPAPPNRPPSTTTRSSQEIYDKLSDQMNPDDLGADLFDKAAEEVRGMLAGTTPASSRRRPAADRQRSCCQRAMPRSSAAAEIPFPASTASSTAATAAGVSRSSSRAARTVVEGGVALPRFPPTVEPFGGALDHRRLPLPLRAVVLADEQQADRHGVVLLAQVGHEHEVAEGLRHLLAVHADHRLVHPVPDERRAGGRLRLGPLALVMREDQVGAATVEVDRRVELAHGERRALDVPSRAARAPERLPRRLVLERRLPQHEVERITLVRVVDVAASLSGDGEHLVAAEVAERAERLELRDVEVHAAAGLVGVPLVEHHADEAADVGDG